jgi:hypothetical protein
MVTAKLAVGDMRSRASTFGAALPLARNPMERRFLEQRIGACEAPLRSRYRSARQTVPFRRVVKRERFGPNMTLLGMRDEAART